MYPIKVSIINPWTHDIIKTYCFGSILDKSLHKAHEKAVNNVVIFKEDNFEELREKIFLATDIPTYRQHIYYFKNDNINVTYTARLNKVIQLINILKRNNRVTLGEIPLDNKYIENEVKIEPFDQFKLIGIEQIEQVYVIDLFDYIKPDVFRQYINDEYTFNLLYKGFILKFWPRFTKEAFKDLILNENVFIHSYPDMSKNKLLLQSIYDMESEFLQYIGKHDTAREVWCKQNIDTYITRIIVENTNLPLYLNIRNIFDVLHVFEKEKDQEKNQEKKSIAEIRAFIYFKGRYYTLKKTNIYKEEIHFPTDPRFNKDSSVLLAIPVAHESAKSSAYLFMSISYTGKIHALIKWDESEYMLLSNGIDIIISNVNIIINKINTTKHLCFVTGTHIPNVTADNIVINNVESHIVWKRSLNNLSFATFIKKFESLYDSRILIARQALKATEDHEYLIHKGAYNFQLYIIERMISKLKIDTSNLYTYLSNPIINKKWIQNYSGRLLTLTHHTTSVVFKINSIGNTEFNNFYRVITGFLFKLLKTTQFSSNITMSTKHFYKTRKLMQEDPVLYDLKKYGNKKVYARICQQNKQPLIYTEEEINSLSKTEQQNLTKYWNFTTKKPAYYSCASKEFPSLSFITGQHPDNFCLPCCTKYNKNIISRKNDITNVCLKTRKYDVSHPKDKNVKFKKHVIDFGKNIALDRLSALPRYVKELLYNTDELYVLGIAQTFNNIKCATLNIFARATKISTQVILKEIATKFNEKLFNTLLQGTIILYFHSYEEFKHIFYDLFILDKPILRDFDQWNILIAELIGLVYEVDIFVFKVSEDNVELINVRNSLLNKTDKNLIICEYDSHYNPIFAINPKQYSHSNTIKTAIFVEGTPIINKIKNVLSIKELKQYKDWTLHSQYINKVGLCYAYIFCNSDSKNNNNTKIHIPASYDVAIINIPAIYDYLKYDDLDIVDLIDFLQNNTSIIEAAVYQDQVMYIKSTLGIHYFNPCSVANITNITNIKLVNISYDPHDVNKKILHNTTAIANLDKLNDALYINYQYRLFLIEFTNYIDKERNEQIRNELKDAIIKTDFNKPIFALRKQVKKLLYGTDDYVEIMNTITYHYNNKMNKNDLIAFIQQNVYSFDRIFLKKLLSISKDEIKIELNKIVHHFITVDKVTLTDFPNIYLPCEDQSASYCKGNKLIVSNVDELIEFLSDDLSNQLKRQYFIVDIWINNYIDYFSFKTLPNERLILMTRNPPTR